MTGIEVAGLVLGAIPVVVELGKAGKELVNAIQPKKRDLRLSSFYSDFYLETVLLRQ